MTTRRAIRDYHEPAGGWGALKAVAVALTEQDTAIKGSASLLRQRKSTAMPNKILASLRANIFYL
jgi:hypothetical protein